MAQEFTIKSDAIENKIEQLLPSQGGFGAGVDFSASTMVVPIVDLTETAEGSALRQDLQSCFSLTSSTAFSVISTTSTLINTTGYFRIFGTSYLQSRTTDVSNVIEITDGTTTKALFNHSLAGTSVNLNSSQNYDFLALIKAGESITATATGSANLARIQGVTRQIADLAKNLIDP